MTHCSTPFANAGDLRTLQIVDQSGGPRHLTREGPAAKTGAVDVVGYGEEVRSRNKP